MSRPNKRRKKPHTPRSRANASPLTVRCSACGHRFDLNGAHDGCPNPSCPIPNAGWEEPARRRPAPKPPAKRSQSSANATSSTDPAEGSRLPKKTRQRSPRRQHGRKLGAGVELAFTDEPDRPGWDWINDTEPLPTVACHRFARTVAQNGADYMRTFFPGDWLTALDRFIETGAVSEAATKAALYLEREAKSPEEVDDRRWLHAYLTARSHLCITGVVAGWPVLLGSKPTTRLPISGPVPPIRTLLPLFRKQLSK